MLTVQYIDKHVIKEYQNVNDYDHTNIVADNNRCRAKRGYVMITMLPYDSFIRPGLFNFYFKSIGIGQPLYRQCSSLLL